MSDHHEEEKPKGFLNIVFDSTIGGFAVLYVGLILLGILGIVVFG